MSLSYWDFNYAQQVYQYLKTYIGNDYGVSGLMGNLFAESHICPFVCQGDSSGNYEDSYFATMDELRVMSSYQFERYHLSYVPSDQVGYSLAQWTTYSRKANYYNYCGQSLLGDGQKSMEFLKMELQTSYPDVWQVLITATSIRQASNKVLFDFESPQDQSQAVQDLRASYSQEVYDDFSGLPPIGTGIDLLILRKILKNQHKMVL